MDDLIQSIIERVDDNCAFDAHYVIDTLVKEFSDDYLRFAAANSVTSNQTASNVTSNVHSQLAKVIATFEHSGLIRRLDHESWSYNLHVNASRCTLWVKLKTLP